MRDNAWANTRAIIIAVNIFGAPDGFLPRAVMLAKAQAAITKQGPNMQIPKINRSAILRLIIIQVL